MDGVLVEDQTVFTGEGHVTSIEDIPGHDVPVTIGRVFSNPSAPNNNAWKGLIDEVEIYKLPTGMNDLEGIESAG